MNAQEVYETVKDWPREAWPDGLDHTITMFGHAWGSVIGAGSPGESRSMIPSCLAELAFEAAGMRWLELGGDDNDHPNVTICYGPWNGGDYRCSVGGRFWMAPTRLSAISSAVMAVKGKQ